MTSSNSQRGTRLSRLAKRGEAKYYPRSASASGRSRTIKTFRLKPGVKLGGKTRRSR